jgi:hypothetical protein
MAESQRDVITPIIDSLLENQSEIFERELKELFTWLASAVETESKENCLKRSYSLLCPSKFQYLIRDEDVQKFLSKTLLHGMTNLICGYNGVSDRVVFKYSESAVFKELVFGKLRK